MSNTEQRMRGVVAEQAASWLVECREGLEPVHRREFVAWLKASPVHIEEYLSLVALTQDLRSACEALGESVELLVASARVPEEATAISLWPASRSGWRSWRLLAPTAALLALVAFVFIVGHFRPEFRSIKTADEATQHLQTRHGEQRTYRLGDRSVVHLNTDTAITVRFADNERRVTLERGEAVFEVTHESNRPFRVLAGALRVDDIGTIFDVKVAPAGILVTVVAGKTVLQLTHDPDPASAYLQLSAGQQARVAGGVLPSQPIAADIAHETAWLHRKLNFQNEPLSLVADEFNRYAPVPFEIRSDNLRSLRISGVFATDDSDAFIDFLRSIPRVHVRVTPTQIQISQY